MKGKTLLTLCIVFSMVIGIAAAAQADPIGTGGDWYEFLFASAESGGAVSAGTGAVPSSGGNSVYAPDPAWTFTSSSSMSLTVTDAFLYGDAFTVYDFGALVGSTPAVAIGGSSGLSDPALALLDPGLSHASFLLGSGAHSLTMVAYQTVTPGAAYFRTDAVPEPVTLLLFGAGLLGVGIMRRRFAR
jgi:hypothetical protein